MKGKRFIPEDVENGTFEVVKDKKADNNDIRILLAKAFYLGGGRYILLQARRMYGERQEEGSALEAEIIFENNKLCFINKDFKVICDFDEESVTYKGR